MTWNWFLVVFRHKFLLFCDRALSLDGSPPFILRSHPLSFDKGGLNSVERAGQSVLAAQMCHIKFLFPNIFRIAAKITFGRIALKLLRLTPPENVEFDIFGRDFDGNNNKFEYT